MRSLFGSKIVVNIGFVVLAVAVLIGVHMLSPAAPTAYAQSATPSPTPTPTPTATPTPTPTPTPSTACSPGFWKNHTELWFGSGCGGYGGGCDQVLADLKSKGPGSDALRHGAAAYLEATFGHLCDE